MPYNRITVVYPYFDRNRTVSTLTLTVYGTVYDGHRPYWTVNCTVVTVYGTVTIPMYSSTGVQFNVEVKLNLNGRASYVQDDIYSVCTSSGCIELRRNFIVDMNWHAVKAWEV